MQTTDTSEIHSFFLANIMLVYIIGISCSYEMHTSDSKTMTRPNLKSQNLLGPTHNFNNTNTSVTVTTLQHSNH